MFLTAFCHRRVFRTRSNIYDEAFFVKIVTAQGMLWRSHWHCVKNICIQIFSGPYLSAFGLNTETYSVNIRTQSEYGKIRTRKNSEYGHFCAVWDLHNVFWVLQNSKTNITKKNWLKALAKLWQKCSNSKSMCFVFLSILE